MSVIGDNKEFPIADASAGDITIYCFNSDGNDSSDDTATTKYMDNNGTRSAFSIRTDQVVLIVRIGDVTMTDPITVPKDGSVQESWYENLQTTAGFDRIVIRPTVDNTNVKLRVKGR